jgi:hypothetical protein
MKHDMNYTWKFPAYQSLQSNNTCSELTLALRHRLKFANKVVSKIVEKIWIEYLLLSREPFRIHEHGLQMALYLLGSLGL